MAFDGECFRAGGDIHPSRFVTKSAAGVVVEGAATDDPFGISQPGIRTAPLEQYTNDGLAAKNLENLGVYLEGQVCLLELVGTVTIDQYIKPSTNGKGVAATANLEKTGAKALETGSSGDFIRVLVKKIQISV